MIKKVNKNKNRQARQYRVRKKISGTPERPRLTVFRSSKNIYAQVIDDINGNTLVSASTLDEEFKTTFSNGGNKEAAKVVGEILGKRAVGKGIENVVFDRAGYLYHGRVKELADGAREAGLKF
jgi:large subunit ribosomal protein L18